MFGERAAANINIMDLRSSDVEAEEGLTPTDRKKGTIDEYDE